MGKTTPTTITSIAGLLVFRHDFSKSSTETWRTTNYLKSVNSISKKRTKSIDSFIEPGCAERANVLSPDANALYFLNTIQLQKMFHPLKFTRFSATRSAAMNCRRSSGRTLMLNGDPRGDMPLRRLTALPWRGSYYSSAYDRLKICKNRETVA
ncbi:hypothetical protein [Burkholderia stagnalis]|uniref:hypothetical protein n=1 Tax=Burkholderia stagnalis TaxID=1503054 RepID=UPI0012D9D61B|nr:hypothetical protein [Burkholderia stagnalis]